MNNRSAIRSPQSAILIAGGGPAGASLAIRLARLGFETTLVERERFPRQKLCGEFISPECLNHFKELDVLDDMLDAGGDRVHETRFFETGGRSVDVPSEWFGGLGFALSLSRAEMDDRLLSKAKATGVRVIEGAAISSIETEGGRIASVKARGDDGTVEELTADIFIDATGRSRILSKLAKKQTEPHDHHAIKPTLVGFKNHLRGVGLPTGVCEIYSFPSGYAGVSHVEDGLANLCFLIEAETVRSVGSDAATIVEQVVLRNARASMTLRDIKPVRDWLAVSIEGFGRQTPAPLPNLLTVGDSAAFIDPFTGSGMVMAMESAEVLAGVLSSGDNPAIGETYSSAYRKRFASRLRLCSGLRRMAFMPRLATAAVGLLGVSDKARRYIARATRR